MKIDNQLLVQIEVMSKEQQEMLCDFLTFHQNQLGNTLHFLNDVREFNLSKEKTLACMLKLIFESYENNVSFDVVYNALSPVLALVSSQQPGTQN